MNIRFDEYKTYPASDILEVTNKGIMFSSGLVIDYAECAANFYAVHGGSGKCVGERDVSGSAPSIGFYTAPLTTHIVFESDGKLREFFRKETAVDRFHKFCRQIADAGYTTCDMS